jgi:hypothetical protein
MADSNLLYVEFSIQPVQFADIKGKFSGYAVNGRQMTKLYGVYEQQ